MYDSNTTPSMLAVTGGVGGVGLATASWLLVAVAVIAVVGTLLAVGRRWAKRDGAKP